MLPALPPQAAVAAAYIGRPLPVKTRTLQVCLARAAGYYHVPVLLLDAIVWQEGGTDGVGDRDPDGSYDLGLAQINTRWLPVFSKYGITARSLLDNPCENLYAAAYVLDMYANLSDRNWFRATMAYNVGPNGLSNPALYRIGYRYASGVMQKWRILYRRALHSG
ncbi:MAG: lytic transglycosylase domain-containing protein [Steroidobacteraceae bacterium]